MNRDDLGVAAFLLVAIVFVWFIAKPLLKVQR